MRNVVFSIAVVYVITLAACSGAERDAANTVSNSRPDVPAKLKSAMKAVEPFFQTMGEPEPGDWLATFREKGQTFEEFLAEIPAPLADNKRRIYIMPLGSFRASERQLIDKTKEFIEVFYGLPVELLPYRKLPSEIRADDFRIIDYPKHRQIRTGYILESILKPALPSDAAVLIAFTNEDLFPDSSMFFVFGQASLDDRVGVWSLYRLDDLADDNKFFRRTLKIAVHETGHMFGLRHCTKYECVMSGTNHLAETDSRPIDACPECMAKIVWFTRTEPKDRYKRMYDYSIRNGMRAEAEDFREKLMAVSSQ